VFAGLVITAINDAAVEGDPRVVSVEQQDSVFGIPSFGAPTRIKERCNRIGGAM
jgi:hypothetical protein